MLHEVFRNFIKRPSTVPNVQYPMNDILLFNMMRSFYFCPLPTIGHGLDLLMDLIILRNNRGSGDAGIDGIIHMDRLGLDKIY